MPIQIIDGNIFTSPAQTLVNTVNCFGVMGAGIAQEYAIRYPKMLEDYKKICERKLLEVGKLWIYDVSEERKILNFPTKKHWRDPSQMLFLELGMQKFLQTYQEKGITSIAFPLLGAQNGGLDPNHVQSFMEEKLSRCEIDISIYRYDKDASDDIAPKICRIFQELSLESIQNSTSLTKAQVKKISEIFLNNSIRSLNQCIRMPKVGAKTVQNIVVLATEIEL